MKRDHLACRLSVPEEIVSSLPASRTSLLAVLKTKRKNILRQRVLLPSSPIENRFPVGFLEPIATNGNLQFFKEVMHTNTHTHSEEE